MTFDEIVTSVMRRLNLSSTDAKVRIEQEVNDRYARVTSSPWMPATRRVTVSGSIVPGGSRDFTFAGLEKVLAVYDPARPLPNRALDEMSYDQIQMQPPVTTYPSWYAIKRVRARQVEVRTTLAAIEADGAAYLLNADGYEDAPELKGDLEPAFPVSFHDILVHGVTADELLKMEKPDLAEDRERRYENRLSELRYFMAKSGYLDYWQGRTRSYGGPFPGLVRTS